MGASQKQGALCLQSEAGVKDCESPSHEKVQNGGELMAPLVEL